jgi:hypothetical protein
MNNAAQVIPSETLSKATIYSQGMFGYSSVEVNDLDVTLGKWAQYDNAVHLTYRKKRARSRVCQTLSYQPSGVVVEGWGHPKFNNFGTPQVSESGTGFTQGLHMSCSPKWAGSLDAFLKANDMTPVVDFDGFNTYRGDWV